MRLAIGIVSLGLLAGCVTTGEYDRDQAYTQCREVEDKAERDSCMEDAVADAMRERDQLYSEYEDEVAAAERRQAELEALGVPEKQREQSTSWPLDL